MHCIVFLERYIFVAKRGIGSKPDEIVPRWPMRYYLVAT